MEFQLAPWLLAAASLLCLLALGVQPARLWVRATEAQQQFQRGSTSFLRRMAGRSSFCLWLLAVAASASFFADWIVIGDLEGAARRFYDRLRYVAEIAIALADSD